MPTIMDGYHRDNVRRLRDTVHKLHQLRLQEAEVVRELVDMHESWKLPMEYIVDDLEVRKVGAAADFTITPKPILTATGR